MKITKSKIATFKKHLCGVRKQSGKSYTWLIFDFLKLRRRILLRMDEYHNFEFERQPHAFRESFLSMAEQTPFLRVLNPKKYYIIARNKYFSHLFLEKLSIRKTQLYCYYHPESRITNDCIAFDYDSVVKILKEKRVESCVIKTTESSHGEGVIVINKIDFNEDDCILTCYNGQEKSLKEILKFEPLVFEKIITQTKQFESFNPTSVNTVRFMTTLFPDGSARIIAIWMKFGRLGSCVDNAGSGGNIDAGVDIQTGKIFNVTEFNGWRNTSSITHHPDTGAMLEGMIIENWDRITADILSFQKAMPFLKAVGWDVAITDNGPVIVEFNDNWETTGQLFIKRGWKPEIKECYASWKKLVDSGVVSYRSGRGIDP